MPDDKSHDQAGAPEGITRRSLLQAAPAALAPIAAAAQVGAGSSGSKQPNIVLIISDQFRWDCVGAMGLTPMNLTPNIDAMAKRGVLFQSAISNQPVCAPARGSLFTGQYPIRHGVWTKGIALNPATPTLASSLHDAGYSTNHIGKWHLGGNVGNTDSGPVATQNRGGFSDLWQSSNVLELTSHPYEGDLFDNDGKPIHFSGVYRTDYFMTGLMRSSFLRKGEVAVFLTLSYLEVHHQNDTDSFVPPKRIRRTIQESVRATGPQAITGNVAHSACRLLRVRSENG